MSKDDNSLAGWANIIREQSNQRREHAKRFPETVKLSLVSGRWQEALQLIEWLSEHDYMEPNIPADKTQELAARYLGLDIVKLRAETVQQAQEQGVVMEPETGLRRHLGARREATWKRSTNNN